MSSKFFTNSNERSLFDKFTGIISDMPNLYAFYAVVGYFRSSGYFAIQPYLKDLKEIKILVGINVDKMFAETQRRGLLFFGDEKKTKQEFLDWFVQDIREAKYSEEVEKGILQFVNDLVEGRIEVRAHNSKAIHAKFYLFLPEHHTANSDGWVIMGSSNMTEAGLGIKKSPNYELNIALKDYDDVSFAKGEFERLWNESTAILPADIEGFRKRTHIDQKFRPFELYMKFLIEYFGENIEYDPDSIGDLPKTFKRLSYQVDAVNQGLAMLKRHDGFFLADVVGLGKTVVAAIIANRFRLENSVTNTKILVVYPPSVEKNWKATFRQFRLDRFTDFVSNGSLSNVLDENNHDFAPPEEYDLILVDEAHRFRNHTSQMFSSLQRICKAPRCREGGIGGRKKVILISATPLNNRPEDLYHQIQLFQDVRRSTISGPNLQKVFAPILREYKKIISDREPDLSRIGELYAELRERVIYPITVRRTRTDLERYEKYKLDLADQGIVFPEAAPPRPIEYGLEGKIGKLFAETMNRLTTEEKIGYWRYRAVAALRDEVKSEIYPQAEIVSKSLAGIFKTLMVKRLESSFFAFKRTLANFANATERMISMFDRGGILIAPNYDVNSMMEKGMSIEEIEQYILERTIDRPDNQNRVFNPEDFDQNFPDKLRSDLKQLRDLIEQWNSVDEDPKLEIFFRALDDELFDRKINPPQKLVIFTESTDTADYLAAAIKERTGEEALNVSAGNRARLFETIQENFDANYTGKQKDDYRILITTDVLAEGVNLHRANVLLNYDTPWNAARLMQRIGRVNRIGSQNQVIYSYSFYPSPQGDEFIGLYNRARVRLQGFHSAFGEDAQIYTHEEFVKQFEMFQKDLKDEADERLKYLEIVRKFRDTNPSEFRRIKRLPPKARTGRKAELSGNRELKGSTVAFLKSSRKFEFYKVEDNKEPEALTFLEAAAIFEAKASESPKSLPPSHYLQVEAAISKFENEYLDAFTEIDAPADLEDQRANQARRYLRAFLGNDRPENVSRAAAVLIDLIEKGTITALPNEVVRLSKRQRTGRVTPDRAMTEIVQLAARYGQPERITEQDSEIDLPEDDFRPEVVLSESFV